MFYRVLSYFFEKEINLIWPSVNRFLLRDLSGQKSLLESMNRKDNYNVIVNILDIDIRRIENAIETIEKRLMVGQRYLILIDLFKTDSKRRYMINNNFRLFLKALKYLYNSAESNIRGGILTAPPSVYRVTNETEKTFAELTKEF